MTSFVDAPALLEIAWRQILYSTILGIGVLAITRRLPASASALQYVLWGLVLARLVLPPDLSAPMSARAVLAASWASWSTTYDDGARSSHSGPEPMHTRRVPGSIPESIAPGPSWLLAWMCGSVAFLFTRARRRRTFRRAVRTARLVEEGAAFTAFGTMQRALAIRRRVRLLEGDDRLPPFTLGIMRPVVVVPRRILRDGSWRLRDAVLAHELAHVRRFDSLRMGACELIDAVYFFHPVARLAVRRFLEAGERLADEMAVRRVGIPAGDYAAGMLQFLKWSPPGPAVAPTFGRGDTSINKERWVMRLESVLACRHERGSRLPMAGILAAGLFVLPMAAGSSTAPEGASSQESTASRFVDPLPGARITSPYGPARDPWTREAALHEGIDLRRPLGTEVVSSLPGRVTAAGEAGGWGMRVVVTHADGLETFYAHLDSLSVEEGETVASGDPIGTLGRTGRVTGPHLHFAVRLGGEPVDPADYVRAWRRPAK